MNKISIKSLYKKKITDEDMMHRNCKGDSSEAALI
jgi:hypothetical protein